MSQSFDSIIKLSYEYVQVINLIPNFGLITGGKVVYSAHHIIYFGLPYTKLGRYMLDDGEGWIFRSGNILAEAWLSFLGLGARPPTPSWGTMITEGQIYLTTRPWVCVYPGLALLLTVLAFNLLGDGLRDALDPKLKR